MHLLVEVEKIVYQSLNYNNNVLETAGMDNAIPLRNKLRMWAESETKKF